MFILSRIVTSISDQIPSIPPIYQARVEINEKDQNSEMIIYYDFQSRKAALEIKNNMKYEKIIFKYDTNEIFVLKCKK